MRHRLAIPLLLLAGCVSLPDYSRIGLAEAAPGIAWPSPSDKKLPLALLEIPPMPAGFAWLAAYDRNADQLLDPGEMSLAWLDIAAPGHSAPQTGFRLSPEDEGRLRARLESLAPERLAEIEKLIRTAREAGMARGQLLLVPAGR